MFQACCCGLAREPQSPTLRGRKASFSILHTENLNLVAVLARIEPCTVLPLPFLLSFDLLILTPVDCIAEPLRLDVETWSYKLEDETVIKAGDFVELRFPKHRDNSLREDDGRLRGV